MVKAWFDARKTQTRRLIKSKHLTSQNDIDPYFGGGTLEKYDAVFFDFPRGSSNRLCVNCPYGGTGDKLWGRETWATIVDEDECSIKEITEMNDHGPASLFYRDTANYTTGKWRPSIYMPRWASRIDQTLISVKVERLKDIEPLDVIAEGFIMDGLWRLPEWDGWGFEHPTEAYIHLFESIHGKEVADSNPWLWCLEFERYQKP